MFNKLQDLMKGKTQLKSKAEIKKLESAGQYKILYNYQYALYRELHENHTDSSGRV